MENCLKNLLYIQNNIEKIREKVQSIFKKEGESQGFVLGQVPYHRAGKYIGDFVKGRIPEWRSFFSAKWLKKKISGEIDVVYSFVYSPSTLLWGQWISIKKRCRHIIHIADHSKLFFEPKWNL